MPLQLMQCHTYADTILDTSDFALYLHAVVNWCPACVPAKANMYNVVPGDRLLLNPKAGCDCEVILYSVCKEALPSSPDACCTMDRLHLVRLYY